MKRLLLLALLLIASPSWAAITVVGHTKTAGSGTVTISASHDATAGNGLIIIVANHTADGLADVAMSGETLLAAGLSYNSTSSSLGAIWYVKSVASTATKTLTATYNASWVVDIFEVSGHDTTTFLDATSPSGGARTGLSETVTTVAANAAIFAVGMSTASEPTTDTGYTVIELDTIFDFTNGQYNLDVGAADGKTVQFGGGGGDSVLFAAAFKPAVVASTATSTSRRNQ